MHPYHLAGIDSCVCDIGYEKNGAKCDKCAEGMWGPSNQASAIYYGRGPSNQASAIYYGKGWTIIDKVLYITLLGDLYTWNLVLLLSHYNLFSFGDVIYQYFR